MYTSTMSAFLSSLVFFATFVNETSIRGQFSFINVYLWPSSPTLERFDFGISVEDYTGSIEGILIQTAIERSPDRKAARSPREAERGEGCRTRTAIEAGRLAKVDLISKISGIDLRAA